MADPRDVDYNGDDEGASLEEQLLNAARTDNVELLEEIIEKCKDGKTEEEGEKAVADLLNNSQNSLGEYAYHLAALEGNQSIIDVFLSQGGFECDPQTPREGDTPLHSAVRCINNEGPKVWEAGMDLIELILESSDPRIRNKANLTPFQLTDPANTVLRKRLEDAIPEYIERERLEKMEAEGRTDNYPDLVDIANADDDDADSVGSASDEEEREDYLKWLEEQKAKKAASVAA